jgi:hypothetical protein
MNTNRTLDSMVAEIAERGWSINNLFQLQDGMWRANLRVTTEDRDQVRTIFHEFADANTAQDALAAALFNMMSRALGKHSSAGIASVSYTPAAQRALVELEHARVDLTTALEAYCGR